MSVLARFGLPTARKANGYWAEVHLMAARLAADGCSGVSEVYRDACLEHDIHYRTGKTLAGAPLTREDADAIFRARLQELSPFGVASPMSWWRWVGVRVFGGSSWQRVLATG